MLFEISLNTTYLFTIHVISPNAKIADLKKLIETKFATIYLNQIDIVNNLKIKITINDMDVTEEEDIIYNKFDDTKHYVQIKSYEFESIPQNITL